MSEVLQTLCDSSVSLLPQRPTSGTKAPSLTSQNATTEQGKGGSTQPSSPTDPPQPDPTWTSKSDPDLRTGLGKNNYSREDVGGPRVDNNDSTSLPVLPLAPTNCFSREEIVNEIMDLTDQLASVALFGSIGVGKSSVALTLLHHNRTEAKFGTNRHFMHCDNLTNSLEGFLERLSDVIRANRTTDVAQLRSHLESSPPLILLLDGVDLILDPLAPDAEQISATIEEFGSYEHVCLVTTSRMHPDIHGFHRVEIPILSEDGARDTFYSLCELERSPAVDDLIARLDFHPLSINLLATAVRENNWDEPMLLRAWGDDPTSVLNTSHHQGLKETVESLFCSPTIKNLGITARDALEAIAAFPCGIEESILDSTLPEIPGIGEVIAAFCKFSLLYRKGGFVKMLSPFRFHFMKSIPCYPSIAGPFVFSLHLFAVSV